MASVSVKDLLKSLESIFSNAIEAPPSTPNSSARSNCLPQSIQDTISKFLEKHQDVNEADSQSVQDVLLNIRDGHVESDRTKLGAFLQTLRLLKPAIRGQARTQQWWELIIAPVVDGIGYKRVEVDNAVGYLVEVLEHGAGEEKEKDRVNTSAHFANLLVSAYLARTVPSDADSEGKAAEQNFIAKQLEGVLVEYGTKKPKGFFLALDRLLLKRDHRLQALALMSAFVNRQPPQLFKVTETPVIEHLLQSLMVDTSTTATALALHTLIMFLPHIPGSVVKHLPRLFLIYSRLLCWESINPTNASHSEEFIDARDQPIGADEGLPETNTDNEWEKLQSSFETAETTAPELLHFFTFLYALYPLNFTAYIHKPRKYLKSINFPRAEEFDLDQAMIRKKSEQFRRVHMLHSNFFTTTLEEERADDRWVKTNSADIIAEFLGLYIPEVEPMQQPGPPPSSKLPPIPGKSTKINDIPTQSLMPDALRTPQRTQSSPGTPSTGGSPMSSAQDGSDSPELPASSAATIRAPIIQTPSSTASGSPRIAPLTRDQMPRSPALRPTTAGEANMAYFQREVMLLRNDLNFERYLKKQHLAHIGQLQKRSVKEATVEAETQNILNINRTLKAQLDKANLSFTRLKRETVTGRSQSKKWETELGSRVRNLTEKEKKLENEDEELRLQLAKTQQECEQLRQLYVDIESKELIARQELQFAEVKFDQLDKLKGQLAELEELIRTYQTRELESGQANDEREALKHDLDTANLLIEGRDASAIRVARNFENRIMELEGQLNAAQAPVAGGLTPQVQTLLDAAVAKVNAKYYSLKRDHAALRHKYVELELRHQQLQEELASPTGASGARSSEDAYAKYNTSIAPTGSGIPHRPLTSPSLQDSLDHVYASTSAPNNSPFLSRGTSLHSESGRPIPSPTTSTRANVSATAPSSLPSIRPGASLLTSMQSNERGPDSAALSPATQSHLPGGHRLPSQTPSSMPQANTASLNTQAAFDSRSVSRWSIDSWDRTTQGSADGKEKKEKVTAKDQVRVRGRGGAQNIGKAKKEDVGGSGASATGVGSLKKKGLGALLGR